MLSLIENEINSAYDDQIKALDAIEKSNKIIEIPKTKVDLDKKIELHELEENHYTPRRHSDHAL